MKTPGLVCSACGSENLRRSKRRSVLELANMTIGVYPFRCLDCDARSWVSIWLISNLAFAKCPRCLRTELAVWPERRFHLTPWRRLLLTLGAHTYRCSVCRLKFLSFRPLKPQVQGEAAEVLH